MVFCEYSEVLEFDPSMKVCQLKSHFKDEVTIHTLPRLKCKQSKMYCAL